MLLEAETAAAIKSYGLEEELPGVAQDGWGCAALGISGWDQPSQWAGGGQRSHHST